MLKIRKQKFSEINYDKYLELSLSTKYGLNTHPIWLETYFKTFCEINSELILELIDTKKNDIIGFLFLFKQKRRDNRFFEFVRLIPCGYRPTDFFPIVVENGYEKQFAKLLVNWFKNNSSSWDSIYINYIPKDLSIWKELEHYFIRYRFDIKTDDNKQFLTICTKSGDFNSHINRLGTKKEKYLRYIKRRFEREIGDIQFIEPKSNLIYYFNEFLDQYSSIKDILGQSNPFTRVKELKQFTKEIINKYEDEGFIKLIILRAGEKNIAFCYYFYFNKIIYYSMPSYDNNYKKYSPGTILLYELIKKSFEDQSILEFNFMRSVYDYKLWWKPENNNYVEILVKNKPTIKTGLNFILKKIRSWY